MKNLLIIAALGLSVVLTSGCRNPELAQSPLGDKELTWKGYIMKSYPNFEEPTMMTPVQEKVLQNQSGAATTVEPEPVQAESVELKPEPIASGMESPEKPEPVVEQTAVSAPAAKMQFYTVKKGDTLSKIAKKYYGRKSKWKVIFDANRDVISNKDRIMPGTELKIPNN